MDKKVTIERAGQDNEEITLDYPLIRKAALILRAVNHELRQDIIKLLNQNDSMVVTDIYVQLRIEQSVASQHLAILRKAGVVNTQRDGKYIKYELNTDRLAEITQFVDDITT